MTTTRTEATPTVSLDVGAYLLLKERFEPVVQIGSSRVVDTGCKLLAGAICRQALDLRTIEAILEVVANGSVMSWQDISGRLKNAYKPALAAQFLCRFSYRNSRLWNI